MMQILHFPLTTALEGQQPTADIVDGFLTDYLGEEVAPWQNAENVATAESV